jgi:hypothetical protein
MHGVVDDGGAFDRLNENGNDINNNNKLLKLDGRDAASAAALPPMGHTRGAYAFSKVKESKRNAPLNNNNGGGGGGENVDDLIDGGTLLLNPQYGATDAASHAPLFARGSDRGLLPKGSGNRKGNNDNNDNDGDGDLFDDEGGGGGVESVPLDYGASRECECSFIVHLCSLHPAHANATINMQLNTLNQ